MDKIIIKYFVGFMISLVTKHKVHRKWKMYKIAKMYTKGKMLIM